MKKETNNSDLIMPKTANKFKGELSPRVWIPKTTFHCSNNSLTTDERWKNCEKLPESEFMKERELKLTNSYSGKLPDFKFPKPKVKKYPKWKFPETHNMWHWLMNKTTKKFRR